jgi:hypothetical protein
MPDRIERIAEICEAQYVQHYTQVFYSCAAIFQIKGIVNYLIQFYRRFRALKSW